MKAFSINWAATANHPSKQFVLSEHECGDCGWHITRNGNYITPDKAESSNLEDAMLFTNRGDAQTWAQGLSGAWGIGNTLKK